MYYLTPCADYDVCRFDGFAVSASFVAGSRSLLGLGRPDFKPSRTNIGFVVDPEVSHDNTRFAHPGAMCLTRRVFEISRLTQFRIAIFREFSTHAISNASEYTASRTWKAGLSPSRTPFKRSMIRLAIWSALARSPRKRATSAARGVILERFLLADLRTDRIAIVGLHTRV